LGAVWKKLVMSPVRAEDINSMAILKGQIISTSSIGVLTFSNFEQVVHNAGRYSLKHAPWTWITNGNQWNAGATQMDGTTSNPATPKIEAEDMPLSVYQHPAHTEDMYINKILLTFGTSALSGNTNSFSCNVYKAVEPTSGLSLDMSLTLINSFTQTMTSTSDYKVWRDDVAVTTNARMIQGGDRVFVAVRSSESAGSGVQWYNISVTLKLSRSTA